MKTLLRRAAALGMALALTGSTAALAAEDPAIIGIPQEPELHIAVQLDGKDVTFTDAVPQVREWRTFLPFRTVFEAMGAEVSYTVATDTAPATVSGTRNGRTVTMTLGSTEAVVTEDGVTSTLTMDVAPYADPETWRTYVPVRFAAQALGANVGWDQEAQTVVIVDTEKLADAALEGKSFTYLEKLLAYSQKYNEGIWDTTLTMDGGIQVNSSDLLSGFNAFHVPMTVTAKGTTEGDSKLDLSMNMVMDMREGTQLNADAEDMALLNSLATDGLGITLRGDLNSGVFYLNLANEAFTADLGLDGAAWYSVDLNALLALAGSDMDLAQLMESARDVDYKALLIQALAAADVDDAETGYATFSTLLRSTVNALSDDGFVKNGDTYTTILQGAAEDFSGKLALTLTMKNDAVTAYGMEMAFSGDVEDAGAMSMNMKMAVDEKDQLTGSMTMDAAGMVKAAFDLTGAYTKGTAAPATEPPAGAVVVDLMGLAAQAAATGVLPVQE